jgi:hypothetical protein
MHKIIGKQVLKQLRIAAAAIGKDILGFAPNDIGLNSARSGAAMTMYLSGVSVYTLMLLGHWSSDAFLRYIRKQVKEFSNGIIQKCQPMQNSSPFHQFLTTILKLITTN